MIPPLELMSKLGLRSGYRLWLINAPRELAEELAAGAEVEMVHESDEYDGVIAFFESEAEAGMLMPRIVAEMPPEGRLWVGGTKRWEAIGDAGWEPVEEVRLGEGLSLQRFAKQ